MLFNKILVSRNCKKKKNHLNMMIVHGDNTGGTGLLGHHVVR